MDTIRVRLGRLAGLLVAASLALGLLAAAPHQSATHFFSSATYYQVKSCIRSWSCSISGWQSYKKRPPAAGYRWPSRYVGWDGYAWIFRVFRL